MVNGPSVFELFEFYCIILFSEKMQGGGAFLEQGVYLDFDSKQLVRVSSKYLL